MSRDEGSKQGCIVVTTGYQRRYGPEVYAIGKNTQTEGLTEYGARLYVRNFFPKLKISECGNIWLHQVQLAKESVRL